MKLVSQVPAQPLIHDLLRRGGDPPKDQEPSRGLGYDEGGQTMLAVDQHALFIEDDGVAGQFPFVQLQQPGQIENPGLSQLAIIDIALKPLLRYFWCNGLDTDRLICSRRSFTSRTQALFLTVFLVVVAVAFVVIGVTLASPLAGTLPPTAACSSSWVRNRSNSSSRNTSLVGRSSPLF